MIASPFTDKSSSCRGKHLSYKRGKRNTDPNTSLIQIEGVSDSKAASFYLGKRIAYVYRAKTEVRGTKIRVIWGKVTKTHGMWKSCETLKLPREASVMVVTKLTSPAR